MIERRVLRAELAIGGRGVEVVATQFVDPACEDPGIGGRGHEFDLADRGKAWNHSAMVEALETLSNFEIGQQAG